MPLCELRRTNCFFSLATLLLTGDRSSEYSKDRSQAKHSVPIIQFEVAEVPERDEEDDVEEDGPHGPGVRTGQPGPTHLHIKHY